MASNRMPVFTAAAVAASNVIVSGTNGWPEGSYYVLAGTKLTTPVANWLPIATNLFDGDGNFTFTIPNPINDASHLFYRLQLQ